VAAVSLDFSLRRALSTEDRSGADYMTDLGVVLATATALFTARIVCEQTFLAWTRGMQMTEFSLPQFGLDSIGMLCALLGLLWAITIVILSIHKTSRISAIDQWLIAMILLCCGLWLVPAEQWKIIILRVHGTEHVPKSWIIRAAALGDVRLLDYLLAHGADPDTRLATGWSALGAAASAGQTTAARLLIAHGARLESRSPITLETPLTEAAQMDHIAMVQLLLDQARTPQRAT